MIFNVHRSSQFIQNWCKTSELGTKRQCVHRIWDINSWYVRNILLLSPTNVIYSAVIHIIWITYSSNVCYIMVSKSKFRYENIIILNTYNRSVSVSVPYYHRLSGYV